MKLRELASALLTYVVLPFSLTPSVVQAGEIPEEYQEVLRYLGRQGDVKDNVLKVNLPRTDLAVTIRGKPVPTPLGFGGWVAMTKGSGGTEVMMGDLVLLQDEVNPVMSALLDQGIEVTALHNHFFWEEPRIFYMHIHGRGTATELARRIKPGLDLIGKTNSSGQAKQTGQVPQSQLNAEKISRIIGHPPERSGAVYKITIGREDFVMKEMGAVIGARMGLNTWAAFAGTDADAVVAGDVAMLEHEVTPVLKALRKNGLEIVAIHHHMVGVQPVVIFLHYWGTGPAEALAKGFKTALDELGRPASRAPALASRSVPRVPSGGGLQYRRQYRFNSQSPVASECL